MDQLVGGTICCSPGKRHKIIRMAAKPLGRLNMIKRAYDVSVAGQTPLTSHIYIYMEREREIHTHTHTYMHMNIHTYIHIHIYIYIHTYIHTYTHMCIYSKTTTYNIHKHTLLLLTRGLQSRARGEADAELGWPEWSLIYIYRERERCREREIDR